MVSPKLEVALSRQVQAEKHLAKQLEKVRKLKVAGLLASDQQYCLEVEQFQKLRGRRHQHRMLLGRARFSLRCQHQRLSKTVAKIESMQATDETMSAGIEAVEARLQGIRDQVEAQMKREPGTGPATEPRN